MTPGDLYRTCRVSAWRLETLQHYDVPSDVERQAAFHATGQLPPPRPEKRDDLALIAELRRSGRDIGRVHVVTWPLTPYLRYELAVYAENVAAGEDVRIADDPSLTDLRTDFALFDVGTDDPHVILFDYDEGGRVRGYTHSQDPAVIARCRTQYQRALDLSVPLDTFTRREGCLAS